MLKKLFKSKVDLKHHAKHQQFYNRAGVSMDQFDAHWMPFSGNREFKKNPRMIVAAEGRYLTAADGRQIFDGLSGLWTTGLGHCRSEISKAISEQTATLDFFSGFQFGHPKSFELAERITQFMPEGLNRVFYTGSGSESADTSLKNGSSVLAQKRYGLEDSINRTS